MSRIRTRLLALGAAVAVAIPLLSAPAPASHAQPPADRLCAWWYAIGDTPAPIELDAAAHRYDVVVLNAWETAAMRRLRQLNPKITILVYKDLASTRSYFGAAAGGKDADYLPTGVGYNEAQWNWFARDLLLRPIEWAPSYPQHWQMAVWDSGYQKRWVSNVVDEVVREGWDGVLADNDFYSLRWYSNSVIIGTLNHTSTDRLLRAGLAQLSAAAGNALTAAGKQFVPNVAEPHREPGRLTTHAGYGTGAMDEHFALRNDDGLLSFQGNTFDELRTAATAGRRLLLMTRTTDDTDRRARIGYATAALLDAPGTCFATSPTDTYTQAGWHRYQNLALGDALGEPVADPYGVWTRTFRHGWVAVNPTPNTVAIPGRTGLCDPLGNPAPDVQDIEPYDALAYGRCPGR